MTDKGTLNTGEPHPAAFSAMKYMKTIPFDELLLIRECFASCAIENNRLAEICCEMLNRLMNNQPVSDRYLLGLAWEVKRMREGGE